MAEVQIFWDPSGIQLDTISRKPNISPPNDGDTPYVKMPIRMLELTPLKLTILLLVVQQTMMMNY